jgi:hypothetical protein
MLVASIIAHLNKGDTAPLQDMIFCNAERKMAGPPFVVAWSFMKVELIARKSAT